MLEDRRVSRQLCSHTSHTKSNTFCSAMLLWAPRTSCWSMPPPTCPPQSWPAGCGSGAFLDALLTSFQPALSAVGPPLKALVGIDINGLALGRAAERLGKHTAVVDAGGPGGQAVAGARVGVKGLNGALPAKVKEGVAGKGAGGGMEGAAAAPEQQQAQQPAPAEEHAPPEHPAAEVPAPKKEGGLMSRLAAFAGKAATQVGSPGRATVGAAKSAAKALSPGKLPAGASGLASAVQAAAQRVGKAAGDVVAGAVEAAGAPGAVEGLKSGASKVAHAVKGAAQAAAHGLVEAGAGVGATSGGTKRHSDDGIAQGQEAEEQKQGQQRGEGEAEGKPAKQPRLLTPPAPGAAAEATAPRQGARWAKEQGQASAGSEGLTTGADYDPHAAPGSKLTAAPASVLPPGLDQPKGSGAEGAVGGTGPASADAATESAALKVAPEDAVAVALYEVGKGRCFGERLTVDATDAKFKGIHALTITANTLSYSYCLLPSLAYPPPPLLPRVMPCTTSCSTGSPGVHLLASMHAACWRSSSGSAPRSWSESLSLCDSIAKFLSALRQRLHVLQPALAKSEMLAEAWSTF